MSDSISPAAWRSKVSEIVKAANAAKLISPPDREPLQASVVQICECMYVHLHLCAGAAVMQPASLRV